MQWGLAQVIETKTAISRDGKQKVFADLGKCGDLSLGATIRDGYGASLGSICQDGREFLPSTGFINLSDGELPDLFLASQVGAKSMEASVLSFSHGKYRRTGEWSGWNIEPVVVNGRNGLAFKQYEQHSLTVAYFWNGFSFQEKVVPELPGVRDEVAQSEGLIRNARETPTYTLVDACRKLAVIFVAKGMPDAALADCKEARSQVLLSSRIISTTKGQPVSDEERNSAIQELDAIMAKIPARRGK
jgi:hypothetical protein